ncbi:metallophosphoesterase [Amylibacter ulvae]|uniref:Metallophosphoesterase n=1 Tax=Paramylibacter ulvae TaxID=1651968 RepID=A0ABQ3D652_9RHOB|nr:metallophosphoesterase family protein [Amylibacter ulvae]GHA58876.1 metallophosphoesterase [Amylibacter ulvae]
MSFLKKLFGQKSAPSVQPAFDAAIQSDEPLFVIGDVHGCDVLLNQLLAKRPDDAQLIFVGDLVDRGPNSAAVLDIVQSECQNGAICLMGNHEKMMLDFLDRPTERGPRWLTFGGLQTMESFGIRGISERASEQELLAARDKLASAMPAGQESWIRDLPTIHHSGNVHVVHAAADPNRAPDDQNARILLWGLDEFHQKTRRDGQWFIYGHTILNDPKIENGRIGIDTGAYATGTLTAVLIRDDQAQFFSVKY